MAKLILKLQTPSIELPIKVKDVAGEKDTLKAGFKRYSVSETKAKLKELEERAKLETDSDDSDDLIKNEILYLKDVKLKYEDNSGAIKELHVADTRTAKAVTDLWETPEEALAVLLSSLMDSAPYRSAFLQASTLALLNNDYSSGEVKN
jgi:hypothetical protein